MRVGLLGEKKRSGRWVGSLALQHMWLKVRAFLSRTSLHPTHLIIPEEKQIYCEEPWAGCQMDIPAQEPPLISPGTMAKAQYLSFLIFKVEPMGPATAHSCATRLFNTDNSVC